MGDINIANSSGRDAQVATSSVLPAKPVRWLDDQGRQAKNIRVIKSTTAHDLAVLKERFSKPGELGEAMISSDPEIDLEYAGRYLKETSRVYVDQTGAIVRNLRFFEVVRNPDGTQRERRPRQLADTNISGDTPLRWSGVFVPKDDAIRKFAFTGKVQILHVNGLTYDFLFAMAKDLEDRNSLMLLGAGPKSNQPLILRRGGTPYRGFLEGRTEGERYCLTLHFTNLELKSPTEADTHDGAGKGEAS